jgi:hypothetical protein
MYIILVLRIILLIFFKIHQILQSFAVTIIVSNMIKRDNYGTANII